VTTRRGIALLLASLVACSGDPSARVDAGPADDATRRDSTRDLDRDASILADADGNADAATPDLQAADQFVGPLSLRVMAANLTSGNGQSYTPGHGARIMQAFAPDLVLIQELNYGDDSEADIDRFVADTFGPAYGYYREAGSIPNGVISRFPIVDAGEWNDPEVSNRDFAWARIDLPGPRDLWAVSVHLLSSNSSERVAEARALIGYLRQQVPADALLVLGGDLNTDSRNEGCVVELRDRFEIAAPYPADQDGNGNTSASRNKPLDWLVASAALDQAEVPLVVGQNSFPDGLVFDSRVYQPLSDLPPVLEDDSTAPQMQHMAVIRQFQLQLP
jgi:endonuclease/exonuclease/phosphatase family metal-dependent hydrolase